MRAFDKTYSTSFNKHQVFFSIKNNGHYAIKNIKVFFLHKKRGEVLDYSSKVFANGSRKNPSILPKLARQFSHLHFVRGVDEVEIRILDYEIDRSVGTSPVDLLFK